MEVKLFEKLFEQCLMLYTRPLNPPILGDFELRQQTIGRRIGLNTGNEKISQKAVKRICTVFLLMFCVGVCNHPVMAQPNISPDTEQSTSSPSDTPTTQTGEPSPDNETQSLKGIGMDNLNIVALGLSGLSLAGSLGAIAFVLNLSKQLKHYQQKSVGSSKVSKTVSQPADAVVNQLQKEINDLKRQLKKLEESDRALHGRDSRQGYSRSAPQEPFINSPTDHAQIFMSPESNYPQGKTTQSPSRSPSQQPANAPQFNNPYSSIVSQYNQQPEMLERSATGVAETLESLERRRRDSETQQVTLNRANNYSYWITPGTEQLQWLLPRAGLKLNSMNIDTFAQLFHFQGHPDAGRISLQKPAQVNYIAEREEWE
jgi:hypothetical protein